LSAKSEHGLRPARRAVLRGKRSREPNTVDAAKIRAFVVDYPVNLYENPPMADVRLTAEAREQFTALPRTIQTRVTRLLERLEQWPAVSGAKPLRGDLAGTYRLRTGDYRLQFRVKGEMVFVEKIGHRDGFYED
jgi:mRNA-degrading endonuclease RelE of RelBE toxin-antitoxin system